MLRAQNAIVRDCNAALGGVEMKTMGDGFIRAGSTNLDQNTDGCYIACTTHDIEGEAMPIAIGRWERRDNADRNALGRAALDLCRVNKGRDGIRSSRFYWANADAIVIQTDAESLETLDRGPTPDSARAVFALADLARPAGGERWMEPRQGEETYRMAGRYV